MDGYGATEGDCNTQVLVLVVRKAVKRKTVLAGFKHDGGR